MTFLSNKKRTIPLEWSFLFQRSVNHVLDIKGNQSLTSEVINENLKTTLNVAT